MLQKLARLQELDFATESLSFGDDMVEEDIVLKLDEDASLHNRVTSWSMTRELRKAIVSLICWDQIRGGTEGTLQLAV